MLEILTSLGQINAKLADHAKEQFSKFLEDTVPKYREKNCIFFKILSTAGYFFLSLQHGERI